MPRKIQVDRCPICGASCLPGDCETIRNRGYAVRDGYSYAIKNLHVTFCSECLIGEGGVDIICRVIEADEAQRKKVEQDANLVLKKLHDELILKIKLWTIGIIALVLICIFAKLG
ncbi:MAG: hypothetical protein IJ802_05995 [Kiritimatiellae bacterium]|nr:hypothetical protein [Kiritimatiellia bacterium]